MYWALLPGTYQGAKDSKKSKTCSYMWVGWWWQERSLLEINKCFQYNIVNTIIKVTIGL